MEFVQRNMYVDDVLSPARNLREAIESAKEVQTVMAEDEFHRSGWMSNDPGFQIATQTTGVSQGETQGNEQPESNGLTTESELVLGIRWVTSKNYLRFTVALPDRMNVTRISLASHVARLFAPQGIAAPVTLKARIRLRLLGLRNLS